MDLCDYVNCSIKYLQKKKKHTISINYVSPSIGKIIHPEFFVFTD